MQNENFNDLLAFILVAKEGSFTRAAARLGLSQSALSHTIRGLETRLNVRLFTRTTRSVSPTEIGEHLYKNLSPYYEGISAELEALNETQDSPTGTIRISAAEHVVDTILWPKLEEFLPQYPHINVEVTVDYGMVDIVKERYDAGIRLGESLANGMVAVPIGPAMKMAVVASPAYFKENPPPLIPQDLMQHNCINLRFPTYNNLYSWEFEKDDHTQKIQVKGQLIFNLTTHRLRAALKGLGVSYVPEDIVLPYIESGELVRVLEDWCSYFTGYYLYYPHRSLKSSAFSLLVEALRYKDDK